MDCVSILNDVLGPVMRGPSSSHNAGAHRIATLARSLLGQDPASVAIGFDPDGSYAPTYQACGVDLAFTCGFLAMPLTDERFFDAPQIAADRGLRVVFSAQPLPAANHPNYCEIALVGDRGRGLQLAAKSVGGGAVVISRVEEWPVEITGKWHTVLVECAPGCESEVTELLTADGQGCGGPRVERAATRSLVCVQRRGVLSPESGARLDGLDGVQRTRGTEPVFLLQQGEPLFASAQEMVALAEGRGVSLGEIARAYERALLGMDEAPVVAEMLARYEVMRASVEAGLAGRDLRLQLLQPTARQVMEAEGQGAVAAGGMHTRAAARALAVMHVTNSQGVVCAAPTGGSAGTLPAVVVTLAEERGLDDRQIAGALFAASAIGVIVASRATFAAETAGCQVEIGAAGAMAAAAVVEVAGGTARQAADAAAISFQNCMGLVCDPVQGACEIPCHTRNAVAASSAFVCADLILGGYENPIPLDETIDAVLEVGRMLPRELRCTALGGIAATPSAKALRRRG